VIFKRRFGDLIDRQLDLFEQDNGELLQRVADAEDDYRRAGRGEAEERFGDLQDVLLEGTEILIEVRDNYAATLDDEAAEEYAVAFNFRVLGRFPQFALELEDEEEEEEGA
jgi:isocitrate dehydrogenase kinase/phosphatase